MTQTSDGHEPREAFGELWQRCLRTKRALETLSADPIPPARLPEHVRHANRLAEEIVSLFRALRRHSAQSGDFESARSLAAQLPLERLHNHTDAIEKSMKLASERGAPNPNLVRPPLVAFRARAQQVERRQHLISPRSADDFSKAVGWAAGHGGYEERQLLRRIESARHVPAGGSIDFVRLAKAELDTRSREELGRLAAVRSFRNDPDKALRAVGEIGARYAEPHRARRTATDLVPEPNPIPALVSVLTGAQDSVLRAEAAWALGQVGGPQASRRLMQHLLDTWGDASLPVELRCALVAGLGSALDPYALYRLARAKPAMLRDCYGLLLGEAGQPDRLDGALRMDLIATLVALELRSEQVGVDLKAGSCLARFLAGEADPLTRTTAAVTALHELTTAGERRRLWRWVRGEAELAEQSRVWPDRLAQAAGRPIPTEELRGYLLAAGRLAAIQEDVEASYRALAGRRGEEQPSAAGAAAG